MEIPDHLINKIILHSSKVIDGIGNPTYRTKENARLLKKDIKRLRKLIIKK